MNEFRPHKIAKDIVRSAGSDIFPNPSVAIDIIGKELSRAYQIGINHGGQTMLELEGL